MNRYHYCLLLLFLAGAMATYAQMPPRPNTDSLKRERERIRKENREWAATNTITHFVINSEAGGFGYSILINGKVYIWQTTIPGRKGEKGFAKQEHAYRCALLAIEKIREGEIPPTLTEADLHKIK